MLLRHEGPVATAQYAWRRWRNGPNNWQRVDVLNFYKFTLPFEISSTGKNNEKNSLIWFIPDFNAGSGGHLNIFRIIWNLEKRGYKCSVVIVRPSLHKTPELAEAAIREHFFPLQAKVYTSLVNLPACEFAVATGWDTAYFARAYQGAQEKLYFVQDFEPYFFPVGSEYLLAENTYKFGFFGITAGDWLAKKLAHDYGMQTQSVGFGVELDRYKRLPRREPEIRRVFFYARPPTPRRAFELGMLVLNEVWQRLPNTQFILAGWDVSGYQIPFPHLACGTLALDDLPDLYSQCDVALVLSLTNISLLPLELMASGCAVVSNRGDNVEWLLNDSVACLADSTPEALAGAICKLLQDNDHRNALSARAEAHAHAQPSWEDVALQFEAALQTVRDQKEEPVCVA